MPQGLSSGNLPSWNFWPRATNPERFISSPRPSPQLSSNLGALSQYVAQ